jgi:hypothetical protein
MRFNDSDPLYAMMRSQNGRPIKIDAKEASSLSVGVFEFNETLYLLLLNAQEKDDSDAVENLWAAAHPFLKHYSSEPLKVNRTGEQILD